MICVLEIRRGARSPKLGMSGGEGQRSRLHMLAGVCMKVHEGSGGVYGYARVRAGGDGVYERACVRAGSGDVYECAHIWVGGGGE